jgi:hypothetical protein
MWEPRRPTAQLASTSCYTNSFTFYARQRRELGNSIRKKKSIGYLQDNRRNGIRFSVVTKIVGASVCFPRGTLSMALVSAWAPLHCITIVHAMLLLCFWGLEWFRQFKSQSPMAFNFFLVYSFFIFVFLSEIQWDYWWWSGNDRNMMWNCKKSKSDPFSLANLLLRHSRIDGKAA